MKHLAIALSCTLLVVAVALADARLDEVKGPAVRTGAGLDCSTAYLLTCDGTGNGAISNAPDHVQHYGCTSLLYNDCTEGVWEICVDGTGTLTVDMGYYHLPGSAELDLFLLGSCDESDCLDASTGTTGLEQVSTEVTPGTYYAVVDGLNVGGTDPRCIGDPPYTVAITCSAPCGATPVDPVTWGQMKALHRHEAN